MTLTINKIEITDINRIQLYLNDEKIKEISLNDILITHSIPAATSRYIIKYNGQEEAVEVLGFGLVQQLVLLVQSNLLVEFH